MIGLRKGGTIVRIGDMRDMIAMITVTDIRSALVGVGMSRI
jgi:hypothetical protein